MLRNILAGATTLALVIAFAAGASANPENRFGDRNTAAATAMAHANATSGAVELGGMAGIAGAGGMATAYAESFNSGIEVISVQEMTATVNGAPIVVFGGIGGAGGNGADGGDFAVAASVAFAGGNGGNGGAGNGGALSSGATTVTVAAGAGTFGGIANVNVASGYFNNALGGVSFAGTGPSSLDGASLSGL